MMPEAIVEAHAGAGRVFSAEGIGSFVREEGAGEPVVCLHGVPTSSFLYRKVLPELAGRGLRGVAFDLPGLGLAERPAGYDYTWTGLGRFAAAAVDALGLERYHLLVHDIGGPVGFELAAAHGSRVRSLLLLNTIVDADRFRRPLFMEPFAHRRAGPAWLAAMTPVTFRAITYAGLLRDHSSMSPAEITAYLALLKRGDGGAAFLQIMRGFERTPAKGALYRGVLAEAPYPTGLLWGANDPGLRISQHGEQARAAIGAPAIPAVPGKHLLPEEQPAAVAEHVAALAGRA
jgi:pimeloyl-ACP methyl ester carboxylesterase